MASQPLNYFAFILGRNTGRDSGRVNPDPIGFFYCRANTARFLDIENFAFSGSIKRKRKAHTRTKTLADGTTLGGQDVQVAESEFTSSSKSRGQGKNIKLVTGKKTEKGNYQTLSFNFPSFATTAIIGEALGELIPTTKIKTTPTAADIFPYFILPTGSRGGIMQKAAADSSTDASVGLNPQITLELVTKLGAIYVAGADAE